MAAPDRAKSHDAGLAPVQVLVPVQVQALGLGLLRAASRGRTVQKFDPVRCAKVDWSTRDGEGTAFRFQLRRYRYIKYRQDCYERL